ncbi:DUF2161 domain-containing phosphodiesterase [Mangrovicoccus algicola]|uniref:Uncharacterized protein n=1 Tax=Mangrovicoccus algicola TaxID=2771008 RepID=A0A8J7CVA0_9RHOB|nr:DUF2161 family putative PD-(D/E)XK-type phosphodiesterase [Mangrovicoccus algicola]MBE3638504.1 hypothetical protein [Mangrovicoccus algicola]
MTRCRETDLYAPLKAFLESQGYEVKSEVAGADIVACRGDEPPVVVEMKTGFSLALFHQGIARQAVTDAVYLAVPRSTSRAFRDNLGLARRLGLGVLSVRLADGFVEPLCDPGPFVPRKVPKKRDRLLREFARRAGDPNTGGRRGAIVTAYRQDCERLARLLLQQGALQGAVAARAAGVPAATAIMAANHYGWFDRVSRGVYGLSDAGRSAAAALSDAV